MAGPTTDQNSQITTISDKEKTLRTLVEGEDFQKHLAAVLPDSMTTREFTRLAFGAFRTTPHLLDSTPESFLNALAGCAAVGLRPNTPEGFAYLIPYKIKNSDRYECQLVLGYKGLCQLMYRSNKISTITGHAVRQGDEFSYERGLNEHLRHIDHTPPAAPQQSGQTGANCIAVWVIITMKDGAKAWDVMQRPDIDNIRKRSPAGANGPWVTDYEPMALKTLLRRMSKLMPMSAQDMQVVAADEAIEAGERQALPHAFYEAKFTVGERAPADDDQQEDMGLCPIHTESRWQWSQPKGQQSGLWSHRIGDSRDFCNPGRVARAKAEEFGMTAEDLNKECKSRFNVTSSGLDPNQLLDILVWLDNPGPGEDAEPAPAADETTEQENSPPAEEEQAQEEQPAAQSMF